VHRRSRRHANVEHHERHRECERRIAQSGEPFERAAGNRVIEVLERRLGSCWRLTDPRRGPEPLVR